MNREYLLNDWYVNLGRDFGPRTIFAVYSAFWGKLIGLPITYFVHYLLTGGIFILATYRMALLLFKNRKAAILTAITILFGATYSIGGNLLITSDFTVTQLSLSISLLAIVLILEERYFLSSILFAVSSYFHPQIGPESALLAYFSTALTFILTDRKILNKKMAVLIKKAILPYLIFVMPLLIFYLKSSQAEISTSLKINIIAFVRTPHHFLPAYFPLSHYLAFFIVLICGFIILRKLRENKNSELYLFISFFTLFTFFITVISLTALYSKTFYPLVILQPFRLTVYIYWFMALTVIGAIFLAILKNKIQPLFSFVPLFLSDYSRLIQFNKVNTAAIILGLIIVFYFKKIPFKALTVLILIFFSLFHFHEKFNYGSYYQHPVPEVELAQWAKNNTTKNDIFLIPPEFEKFRLISERPVVADWKSFPFQEKGYYEWYLRMCDLGNQSVCDSKNLSQDKVTSGFRTHTLQSLVDLGRKYQAKYAVSEVDYPELKKLYSNFYQVYMLP